MRVLSVEKLTKSFGGLAAVSNVSLHLEEKELVGLIGPNGAGKTTIFNLLTGVYQPTSGSIDLIHKGVSHSLGNKEPHQVSRLGMSRTFQNIRLFRDLSVLDNVRIAMHGTFPYNFCDSFFRTSRFYRVEKALRDKSLELLGLFHLEEKSLSLAKNLPYGEQRRLEIVRALATSPDILLLDEPAAGMNQSETLQLTDIIAQMREMFGLTILLIEHDMSLVMHICERIYVLDYGMLIAEGTAKEIQSNKRVIDAYLGEGAE
ncbi:MAG: ABC transporter ATP-binding protein [Eubacteriaceae bacterium]|jgi:branched-chain amino acid transport system ATP-binding protein|nr:ABC transporter ATP-binding protein [Eubacteriaceae bacterium]